MQVEVLFYPIGRFPQQWEAVELSNIDVCPMYGPFEKKNNGPTAEYFESLNHIQHMLMPQAMACTAQWTLQNLACQTCLALLWIVV
jgi:hypothetical protein